MARLKTSSRQPPLRRWPTLLTAAQIPLAQTAPGIAWSPCGTDIVTDIQVECATHAVPRDYTGQAEATIDLQLVKVPAAAPPSRGSILFNFGGPGSEARQSMVLLGPTIHALTGGQYDLIAFDPRGTGNTLPFTWLETDTETHDFWDVAISQANASAETERLIWDRATLDAELALERAGDTGPFINTPTVARDMMQVVDALGEDDMLRYWGFSYGTTLGATLAAMFPDRVDKMILDAVQNPYEYYFAISDFEEWTDSDKVFSAMFTTCADAGPELCVLADGRSGAELEAATWALLEDLKKNPVDVGGGGGDGSTFEVTYNGLKSILSDALYSVASWPVSLGIVDALLRKDFDAPLLQQLAAVASPDTPTSQATIVLYQAVCGIHCGDRQPRAAAFEDLAWARQRLYTTSRALGEHWLLGGRMATCAQWKIEPSERFEGSFEVQTANPVLIAGTKLDAHTPMVSARNVSASLAGSVVFEVDGYGHTSIANPSRCTYEVISTYWKDGQLPEDGFVCQTAGKPWEGKTWGDVLPASEAPGKRSVRSPEVLRRAVSAQKWANVV